MKKLLVVLALFKFSYSNAQVHFGDIGFTVQSGAVFSYENLSLQPSADLTLTGNALQKSDMPLQGKSDPSITSVFRFATPLAFSGSVTLYYQPGQLNGNSENELQVAYLSAGSQDILVTVSSTRNLSARTVSNTVSSLNLMALTAASTAKSLPVNLIDFSVYAENQTGYLTWSTVSEINAATFEIQRSADSKVWFSIGSLQAAGGSASVADYSFVDSSTLPGGSYYRLKMIDHDGSFGYSQIRSLQLGAARIATVYPNPASGALFFKLAQSTGPLTVSITDLTGRHLLTETVRSNKGITIQHLAPGMYVLKIQQGQTQHTQTFVKR